MRAGVVLAMAMMAVPAQAWPVDWIHDVEAGKERFVKLPKVDWFEVADPTVAQLEWVPEANELVLIGLKPGRTTVLLGAEHKVAAWRIRVGGSPVTDPELLKQATTACKQLELTPLAEVKLTATIQNEACRKALGALFRTDAFEARHLDLTFDGKVLQQQLRELEAGLKKLTADRVQARYVGAGLVLSGTVSPAEHRKVLWLVLEKTLGRFALTDDLEETSEGDAGVK